MLHRGMIIVLLVGSFSLTPLRTEETIPPRVVEFLRERGIESFHQRKILGESITIAILDTGFRGYQDRLGIPQAQIKAKSFRRDQEIEARSSLHGLSCAEIIHRIAPRAKLLLINWEPDSPEHFLQAVKWARGEGASIISCSVIMPSWSDGCGGGAIHEKLADLLGKPDEPNTAIFVAAVGNLAERHWRGMIRDQANQLHEWKPGVVDLRVEPWGTGAVSIELTHSLRVGYRLKILDSADRSIGTEFDHPDSSMGGYSLRFVPTKNETYRIRVERMQGDRESFRLIALGASLDFSHAEGSIVFPADGKRILSVGAIDEKGKRCNYSACGRDQCKKPDCVAVVPVPGEIQPLFGGSSAAAPQIAGMIALIWDQQPKLNARQIQQIVFKQCKDQSQPGFDFETGHGEFQLQINAVDSIGGDRVRQKNRSPSLR